MLKKRIGLIILFLGIVLLITGFIFEGILAGIPYQDPTPELTQKYINYVFVAHVLYRVGIPTASLGLLTIIIMKLRMFLSSRKDVG